MRVAMIARSLPRLDYLGGASGQVHLQATALARRGHDVTVYALTPPPGPVGYRHSPVRVPLVRGRSRFAQVLGFPFAVARLALDGYDIVHAHGDDHLLRTTRPVVRTFYGSSRAEAAASQGLRHRVYHGAMAVFERVSERRATEVAVISAATQRYLRRHAVVIPCGIDPAVFHPSGAKSRTPSILFVGDLGTRKRAEFLLDVFRRSVRSRVGGAELWMVTTARMSGDGVCWKGRVTVSDLVELYRGTWALCLPSLWEGFGVPYIEAMACGTAVVATRNGGAEEILEDGRWGRLVRDDELGDALVELLSSTHQRDEVAARGFERSREYQIDAIAERYEALYRRALERAGHATAPESVDLRSGAPIRRSAE